MMIFPTMEKFRIKPEFIAAGVLLIGIAGVISFFIFRSICFQNFKTQPKNPLLSNLDRLVDIRFDQISKLHGWREYVFNRKSKYQVERDIHGNEALHVSSQNAYSSIFKIVDVPLDAQPVFSWEWRAVKFPGNKKHEKIEAAGENDFAIRVSAIFANNNPFVTEIIQYIWDDYFPAGTNAPSPYSKNVRMLVVKSGMPSSDGEWVTERRDLVKDYERLFGKIRYHKLRAIAIVTNSDDTRTESEAYVIRIWVDRGAGTAIQKKQNKFRKTIQKSVQTLWQSFRKYINPKFLKPLAKKKSEPLIPRD